jgi:NADH:ubiquinone reductase (H+-translocating)
MTGTQKPLMKRIVVIGGGFAGIYFTKKIAKEKDVEVTLISNKDYFLFTPRILDVLNQRIAKKWVSIPFRELPVFQKSHVFCVTDSIEKIDLPHNEVYTQKGKKYSYDVLIVSYGAHINFYGIPGAEDYSLPFKSLHDVTLLQEHIKIALQRANESSWKKFVIVGGGPTGIELSMQLYEYLNQNPERQQLHAEIILVQRDSEILPGFHPKLIADVRRQLQSLGIQIQTGFHVQRVERNAIISVDGKKVEAETILWTAGIEANACTYDGKVSFDGIKRLQVNPPLELSEYPNVFVLGDAACVINSTTGKPYPPTAQVAMASGAFAVRQVKRYIRGKRLGHFTYKFKGYIIMYNNSRGVVQIGKSLVFSGRIPYLIRDLGYKIRFKQIC